MQGNFIKTSDTALAKKLRESGFTSVSQEDEMFIFINDGKAVFSDNEKKRLVYSDILCI